ncbi:protein GLUTELIN PRECURSOR ACCUMULATION 3-like isoform X2 [Telopea speciosissima]|uniref:protein GLUTELIN PRECURSOR ACCUMULATION 3-like isoform X2 n=1 Tax=Telopea speciosissima TaxID=54955 RepID=UPI001CC57EA2|nr:protein GLUTELIN PRECURSOR ACCUMULATION 3-like isoform X2 [Telopea speciosissima]
MRWEKLEVSERLTEETHPEHSRFVGGLPVEFVGPGRRWGHSCNAINGGKLLYVFGGYGPDNCQTNDVYIFDSVKQVWIKPTMRGIAPSPRDSHSCTTIENNLFVFGGTDGKNPLKDLFVLDTSTNTWMCPRVHGEGPTPREGHSAALVGKRLFIFGGCGKSWQSSYEVYYNDLYILDTESLVWQKAVTSGNPPSARDSHTCSSWKNKIIVIGGEDSSDCYLSDVHILDTDALVWRELSTSGHMLPPRAGHSTVILGRSLFVFGGFADARNLYGDIHMLDVVSGVWTKVTVAGQGPTARFSVAGDCLDPQKGTLVFIGGCNRDLEALHDIYYLHTEMSMENGRDGQKQEKFSLKKELKRKCQEQHLPANQPVNDKEVPQHGTMPDLHRPMPAPMQMPIQMQAPVPISGQASKHNHSSDELEASQGKIFEAKVTGTFCYGHNIETIIDGKLLRGLIFSNTPSFSPVADNYHSRKRMALEAGGVKLGDGYVLNQESVCCRQANDVHVHGNPEASMANLPNVKDEGKNQLNPVTKIPCEKSAKAKNMVTSNSN